MTASRVVGHFTMNNSTETPLKTYWACSEFLDAWHASLCVLSLLSFALVSLLLSCSRVSSSPAATCFPLVPPRFDPLIRSISGGTPAYRQEQLCKPLP